MGLYLPEIHRLRGACQLCLDNGNFDEAVHAFEAAITAAKMQQAHSFQLAAAIDLARAWCSIDRPEAGTSPLRDAVGMFTGDDVPVRLHDAKQILGGLNL